MAVTATKQTEVSNKTSIQHGRYLTIAHGAIAKLSEEEKHSEAALISIISKIMHHAATMQLDALSVWYEARLRFEEEKILTCSTCQRSVRLNEAVFGSGTDKDVAKAYCTYDCYMNGSA